MWLTAGRRCWPQLACKLKRTESGTADSQPSHVLLVRGTAGTEIVNGIPAEYLDASKKYVPLEQWDAFETQVRGLYKRMARISIRPEWAKLIDFETTLPTAVERLVAARAD